MTEITATLTEQKQRAREVANTIRQQIGVGVFMSLGMSDPYYVTQDTTRSLDFAPGLRFTARIVPKGKQAARKHAVTVTLTPADLYNVTVTRLRGGRGLERFDMITEEQAEGVYAEDLARLLLSYDNADR